MCTDVLMNDYVGRGKETFTYVQGMQTLQVVERKKKTIPLPGGAELVKLAMSTNTGSVLTNGSAQCTNQRLCNCLTATVIEVDN